MAVSADLGCRQHRASMRQLHRWPGVDVLGLCTPRVKDPAGRDDHVVRLANDDAAQPADEGLVGRIGKGAHDRDGSRTPGPVPIESRRRHRAFLRGETPTTVEQFWPDRGDATADPDPGTVRSRRATQRAERDVVMNGRLPS